MRVQGELRRLLGEECAEALGRRYGGTYLSVPRRGHQAGTSVAALARAYGMSERQVWRIIRG
ncbi:MAG: hypothetical protein OXL36_19650 [Bryobacterales bacterium]|nr:hypothetical protein [Bryobacterales bacterium]MDE0294647.1 hypothetical protein [Bryobacterales bacterium]